MVFSSKIFRQMAIWKKSSVEVITDPVVVSHQLKKIRVDVSSRGEILSSQGSQPANSGTMYFVLGVSMVDDLLESPTFEEGDSLVFDNHEFMITGSRMVHDGYGVHHLEVSLA